MMKRRGAIAVFVGVAAALIGTPVRCRAETFVLPVVARGVQGLNGSVWDSEVRIARSALGPPGAVKRVWVALPGGGFVDDPATAPHWVFPPIFGSMGFSPMGLVVLTGDQLLQGTNAAKGAVALEVDGANNEVFLHDVNTQGQPRLRDPVGGIPCCLAGNGQLLRALRDPLVGEGFIPWLTSGESSFRASVGVVNPTAQARTVTVNLRILGSIAGTYPTGRPDGTYWLSDSLDLSQPLVIDLPPWGFRQIDDFVSVVLHGQTRTGGSDLRDPVGPAMVFFSDNISGLPFYAYASVIYSPLNDPEFIPAVPFRE